jgi:hypothetical protein
MGVNNSDWANQKTVQAIIEAEDHTIHRFKRIRQWGRRKTAMTRIFWGNATSEQQRKSQEQR